MKKKVVIARGLLPRSNLKIEHKLWNCEIASLRPEHHAVQGFARNDSGPLFVIARSGATEQSPSRISYGL